MKEIIRDGARIDYQVSGDGDITLLFVHGSYIDQTYWKDQVNHFSSRFTVVTMDLPGHGMSGRDRAHWTIRGFGEDVVAVVKELDLKSVILIGHSMGADVILAAAVSHPEPVIGFVVVDYFKNVATPLPDQFQAQVDGIMENLKAAFADTNEQYARMALVSEDTPKEIVDRVLHDYRTAFPPMAMETTPEVFEIYKMERELLPQLGLKIYLINADYYPTDEEALNLYAPHGYEFFQMHSTSHYPMLEDPQEFNRLLDRTIKEILTDDDSLDNSIP
jgi:sigma-B regulation protein RsbQ